MSKPRFEILDPTGRMPARQLLNGSAHPPAPQSYWVYGSQYESANYSPNRAMVPGFGGITDYKNDLTDNVHSELVRRSRYLHRTSGFARAQTGDMQLYSVGTGIGLQSLCEDRALRSVYEDYFRAWGARCEVTSRFSFAECQGLVCRGSDIDGQYFVVKVRDRFNRPRLQLIETHRLRSPGKDSDGKFLPAIETDAFGAPTIYHFTQDDGTDFPAYANAVMHVFEPESISALINAPTGQHAINHLIDESEMLALAKLAVKDNEQVSRTLVNERGEVPTDNLLPPSNCGDSGHSDPREVQRIVGGRVVALKPGEKMESYETKRPSPLFTGFLEHLHRDSALGQLPFEFSEDPSAVCGASVRLIVGKACRKFSYRQFNLFTRFLNPTWGYVIGDGIDSGALPVSKGWNKVAPQNPQDANVDAGYAEAADLNAVSMGLMTLEEYYARRNRDFEEEIKVRKLNAQAILAACNQPIDPVPVWMIYAPPGLANIVAMQSAPQPPPGSPGAQTTP